MAPTGHVSSPLTPFDNVSPRRHVVQMLFFPMRPDSDVSVTEEALRSGLVRTFERLPLLSGTIQAARKAAQQGTLYVGAPWHTVSEIFHAHDLRHLQELDYADLRRNHFPIWSLDRKVLLPMTDIEAREKAVMLVQVNFVPGGIIIAMCLHHSFTDGNGMATVAKIWAACCKGEDGSSSVTQDMIGRERLIEGPKSGSLKDFPHLILLPAEKKMQKPAFISRILTWISYTIFNWLIMSLLVWLNPRRGSHNVIGTPPAPDMPIFFFSKSKLAELKDMASKETGHGKDWISTNDALCSLLGCCILPAYNDLDGGKIAGSAKGNEKAVIAVVVDLRPFLDPPLPPDYIGNVLHLIWIALPPGTVESTLSKVTDTSRLIRRALKLIDPGHVDKLRSALQTVPDISRVAPCVLPSQPTIMISSWRNQNFYDLDWGKAIGSKIERVRDWRLAPFKNLVIIMPEMKAPHFADEDCGLEVAMALEHGQLMQLKEDRLFNQFAEWRNHKMTSTFCSD